MSDALVSSAGCRFNLDVEMETGTGKTYVYLRTVFELNQRYGFTKFVVVVPSVAIREGVLKTLRITREHFAALLPGLDYAFFAYDGARLGRLRSFVRSSRVELMVLTLDAFNKAVTSVREIEQCHMIAGGFDYLLKVRTRDISSYRRVLGEKLSALPHVAQTSTFVAMETVKDR